MAESHYRRIASEIAERIRCGELHPGQLAPSTRQIVREWGVAMATATKVIGVLKSDGLVETIPGHGTRVREGQPAGRRGELTSHEVLDAAVRIADADGLELLTMRRLAAALDIPTMALYRYEPTKGVLLMQMADRVFVDVVLPDLPVTHWRRRVEVAASIFRDVFARHPWAAPLFSLTRPQLLPNVLPLAEWNLRSLKAAGLSVEDMMFAHINLFSLVVSMSRAAVAEVQAQADTGQSIDGWAEGQAEALQGRMPIADFPVFAHVIERGFDYDLDAVFEYGLQRMLDGIAAQARAATT